MIKVIHERPPIFDQILAVFPLAARQDVLFAYNGAIYTLSRTAISPALMAHEAVHLERQGETIEAANDWWGKYLTDRLFRFDEELVAHRAEYRAMIDGAGRNARRIALKQVAERLASPLYGRMVNTKQAVELLTQD